MKSAPSLPRFLLLPLFCLLLWLVACDAPGPVIEQEQEQEQVQNQPPSATAEEAVETAEPQALNRLAIITEDGHLLTADADGENVRLLAGEGSTLQFPAWSPSGNQLAVLGQLDDQRGVFVFEDSEDASPVTIHDDAARGPIYLYWKPDGSAVSFIAANPDGLGLHVVPADGSSSGEILATGQPFYWQWLASSDQALIHPGNDEVAFLDLEGNINRTGYGQSITFQAPALSSDGLFFAYGTLDEELNGRLIIRDMALAEQEAGNIAYQEDHLGLLTMSWNPTGPLLAYTNPGEKAPTFIGPLFIFDAGLNGQRTQVTQEDVIAYFWSPDGRYLAYISFFEPNTSADAGAKTVRAKLPAQQSGRLELALVVYDVETDANRVVHTFTPSPLFVGQFIPYFDQYALSHRVWSADSTQIVLPTRNEEGESKITVIQVDGSGAVDIGDGVLAFWSQQ